MDAQAGGSDDLMEQAARRAGRILLALTGVTILLLGVFVAGVRLGRSGDTPATLTSVPPDGLATMPDTATPGGAIPGSDAPDPAVPETVVVDPATQREVTFTVDEARSVAARGRVSAPVVTLAGARTLVARASIAGVTDGVVDVTLHGRVTVRGDVHVRSNGFLVTRDAVSVSVDDDPSPFLDSAATAIEAAGTVSVTADRITWRDSGAEREAPGGSADLVLDDFFDPGFVVRGAGEGRVDWVDAPQTLVFEDLATLSWAGGAGEALFMGSGFDAEHVGVVLDGGAATVGRDGGVAVDGRGQARQIWTDGSPRLKTVASVEANRPTAVVRAGVRDHVVWAPRNDGNFDLAIQRIVPVSEAARWVFLALQPLPVHAGGERIPARGGDTQGFPKESGFFTSTVAIDAVLAPGRADKRDLQFVPPDGTPPGTYEAVIRLEGNFDPVEVVFTIIVEAQS